MSEWRPIATLPGYQISSDGRILGPKGERKLRLNKSGYPCFSARRVTRTVHRLLCIAFHGDPPEPHYQARHLNGIRTDNRVENLAWGTPSQNTQDMIAHGNCPGLNKTHCPRGHEFTPENTYSRPVTGDRPGTRDCKQCRRDRNRIWMRSYKRNKGQAA